MFTKTLAATAAVTLLAGSGAALAAQKAPAQAGPKQPVPYSQLDAYAKASAKQRASKDWWADAPQAQTGMSTDTAALAPSSTASGDTAVNPSPMAAPPSLPQNQPQSLPSTPPTDTDPARAADPVPTTPGATPTVPPIAPK